jgi:hypothetical protein
VLVAGVIVVPAAKTSLIQAGYWVGAEPTLKLISLKKSNAFFYSVA